MEESNASSLSAESLQSSHWGCECNQKNGSRGNFSSWGTNLVVSSYNYLVQKPLLLEKIRNVFQCVEEWRNWLKGTEQRFQLFTDFRIHSYIQAAQRPLLSTDSVTLCTFKAKLHCLLYQDKACNHSNIILIFLYKINTLFPRGVGS